MSKFTDFSKGINIIVMIGATLTPIVAILLAAMLFVLEISYTGDEKVDPAINLVVAMIVSYSSAFLYIKWRTWAIR